MTNQALPPHRTLCVAIALAVVILAVGAGGLVGAVATGDVTGTEVPTIADAPGDTSPVETTAIGAPNTHATPAANTTTLIVRFEPYDDRTSVHQRTANHSPADRKAHAEAAKEPFHERFGTTDTSVAGQSTAAPAVRIKEELWLANAAVVEIDTDRVAKEMLRETPGVERVHENFEVTVDSAATAQPQVDSASTPTAESTATGVTTGLETSAVPDAWERVPNGNPGAGATVAVLDTGVDDDHADITLAENGWAEFDRNGNHVPGSEPHDVNGHGTHVAGTVAGAQTPAGGGDAYGVAPEASLYGVKVLDDDGSGSFAQIIAGMEWAVEQDEIDILQLSLGIQGTYDTFIEPVRNAHAEGTLVVASSGNDGVNTSGSPGNVYEALSVGSIDGDEHVSSFSSSETLDRDADWDDPPADWPATYSVPTMVATGEDVESAAAGTTAGTTPASGTSMAAPHVAGVAALIVGSLEEPPTVAELEDALAEGTRTPAGVTDQSAARYGHGVIDADAALTAAGVGEFTVEIDDDASDLDVQAGGDISVVVDIENTGDVTLTQDIAAAVNGETYANESVTLAGGDDTTETLTFSADLAFDGEAVTVSSVDHSATAELQVAGLTVEIDDDTSELTVTDEEDVIINADVTNTGDTDRSHSLTAAVDGVQQASKDVTVAGETTERVSLAFPADAAFDEQDVTVSIDDATDTAPLSVLSVGELDVAIDEAASDLDVEEGATVSVVVDTENTGDVTLTQDLVAEVEGTERARSTDVTVAGGERSQSTLTFSANLADDGEAVTIRSEDADDSAPLAVAAVGTLDVEIDESASSLAVTDDQDVIVEVEVTNTGETDLTQQVTADVDGEQQTSDTITLAGGATETVTLAFPAETAFDGQDVTVSSDDDADTASLSVTEIGTLDVEINETASNLTVTDEEDVIVDVEVTNTGETDLTQQVTADVDGEQQTSDTITLAGGATETVTLAFPAERAFDGQNVTVSSADDTDSAPLSVAAVGTFDVAINESVSNLTVTDSEEVSVAVEVTNTGETDLTQSLTAVVNDTQQTRIDELSLDAGATETVELSFPAEPAFEGQEVLVSSEDDSDSAPLSVATVGTFDVAINETASNLTVTTEEEVSVAVEATNTGDTTLTQNVTAAVNGTQQAISEAYTLPGGDTATLTLAFPAETAFDGHNVTVASGDDVDMAALAVAEPARAALSDLDIAGDGTNATINESADAAISLNVTNTGETANGFDVDLVIDEKHTETVTTSALDVDATETVTFENVTGDLAADDYVVTVSTTDDERSGTLTVTAPDPADDDEDSESGSSGGGGAGGGGVAPPAPEDVTFDVSDLTPRELTVDDTTTLNVSATITTGSGSGMTQTVAYRINETTVDETRVDLEANDETTVTFAELTIDELVAGNHTHGIYSEDTSETGVLRYEPVDGVTADTEAETAANETASATNETDTVTADDTDTADESATDDRDDVDDAVDGVDGGIDDETPGFTPVLALLAILLTVWGIARVSR